MYPRQCLFKVLDEGAEDAIYDFFAMRKFLGVNFLEEQVPDAMMLLHFRRMIEESKIGDKLFRTIYYVIEQSGYMMCAGTIVDATIINAPISTNNVEKARDPEMHQTKKEKNGVSALNAMQA